MSGRAANLAIGLDPNIARAHPVLQLSLFSRLLLIETGSHAAPPIQTILDTLEKWQPSLLSSEVEWQLLLGMLHAKYSCVVLSFRKPDVVDVPDAEEVVTDTLEKIEKIAILRSFYAAVLPEAKFNEQIETILDTLEQRQPSLFSFVVE